MCYQKKKKHLRMIKKSRAEKKNKHRVRCYSRERFSKKKLDNVDCHNPWKKAPFEELLMLIT